MENANFPGNGMRIKLASGMKPHKLKFKMFWGKIFITLSENNKKFVKKNFDFTKIIYKNT